MDQSYLIFRVDNKKNIELHYFFCQNIALNYSYPICFTMYFDNLSYCFYLISLCSCFNIISTSHKLYTGVELFKAYLSIKLSQNYVQQ
uniref:Uncharacterized protein n=1 Tax=Laurencieae sp. TaxID=2007162 RepID=A0A1Z1M251_9FLOR|nr:hypothetical protein [Laurencieae sp.]